MPSLAGPEQHRPDCAGVLLTLLDDISHLRAFVSGDSVQVAFEEKAQVLPSKPAACILRAGSIVEDYPLDLYWDVLSRSTPLRVEVHEIHSRQ